MILGGARGGQTSAYEINGLGRLVSHTEASISVDVVIDYVSSLPRNLTEGGVRQIWGLELVATSSPTATTYVQHDRLGSVTQTTDATGNVTGTVTCDPWGVPSGDIQIANYTGHDWDSVLGGVFCPGQGV